MIKPTESELEILNIIWEKKTATVREVHDIISIHKPTRYTTTLKLMQIMLEKKILARIDSSSKSHVYEANIEKEQIQSSLLQNLINKVYDGSASDLVIQALGNKKTTPKEIEEIRKYLDSLK